MRRTAALLALALALGAAFAGCVNEDESDGGGKAGGTGEEGAETNQMDLDAAEEGDGEADGSTSANG